MTKEIKLTRGHIALVDDTDYEWLNQFKWTFMPPGYAMRRINQHRAQKPQTLLMHRMIMEPIGGKEIDHINRDGLDNRRENLRVVSRSQNLRNRRAFKNNKSGYKGVSFNKQTGKWRMQIHRDFDSMEEASHAFEELSKALDC